MKVIASRIAPPGTSTSRNSPGMRGESSPLIRRPLALRPAGKFESVPASISCLRIEVAFFLARAPKGRSILACNNYALGSQITAATLNRVIEEGPHKGKSVAFLLSETEKGRSLLKDKNYALGELIINRDETTPKFNEGPRYFENPELLLKFMKMFPDRRADIEKEAPAYVEQLKRFIKLRGTCKELHGFKLSLGDDKGIPDYLEKELMMALCRYSMPVNDEKEAPDDPSNREVKRRR